MAAKFPCPVVLPECGCDQNPVRNISSADPDPVTFTGIKYVSEVPPLGTAWGARNCVGVYESTISQADANQQAQEAGLACAVADWRAPAFPGQPVSESPPVPPPVPTRGQNPYQIALNSPQTGSAQCPDGNEFTYTVAAGTFSAANVSFTQALAIANAKAKSYALQQAQQQKTCLGELTPNACVEQFFSTSITASGVNVSGGAPQSFGNVPDNWEIIGGMLPPGLVFYGGQVFGGTVIINGTPAMTGTFSFTVQITDAAGGTMAKDYSITVSGIINPTLPMPHQNNPYSAQLLVDSSMTNPVFALVGGSFPSGLTMSASGLVTGTTPASGTFTAQVQATSSNGIQCVTPVTITVDTHFSFDWLVWDPPTINGDLGNRHAAASGSWSGRNFTMMCDTSVAPPLTGGGQTKHAVANDQSGVVGAALIYTGPLINCSLNLTQDFIVPGDHVGAQFLIEQDGVPILNIGLVVSGVYAFTIAAGVNSHITVNNFAVAADWTFGNPPNAKISYTGTLSP